MAASDSGNDEYPLATGERTLGHSVVLRNKISLFSGGLDAEANRFWTHSDFPRVYRSYLHQSHAIIRATVPLMRAAIESLQLPQYASDPVAKSMIQYLEQHAEEETGHDQWILDDAEVMGLTRNDILNHRPSQIASQIAGVQYYWIHHFHPVALLGYIAVMEGEPSSPEFFKDVAQRNKLPVEAISSFLYHSKLDPTHKADLDRFIDQLPLGPIEVELIGLSALRTIQYITDLLKEVNQSA